MNVDLLHGYGVSISNIRCLQIKTSLANSVIDNMRLNQGVFVPRDLIKDKFIMFHLDNADFREDAKNTTHVLLLVGFQKRAGENTNFDIDVNLNERSLKLKKNDFGELLVYLKEDRKHFPLGDVHRSFKAKSYQDISDMKLMSTTKVWELGKSVELFLQDQEQTQYSADTEEWLNAMDLDGEIEIKISTKPTIPTWSGYNSLLQNTKDIILTNTFYFPLIPGPSSDWSAVFTALKAAQAVTTYANGVFQNSCHS